MVVRIVSVHKDGTTSVQYHDPATNTYTKTQHYHSTKEAYNSSFYHAFDGTPAFYSPVKKKVDKSWVHSSHSSSSHHHSSSHHSSSSNNNNSSPVFYANPPQTQPKTTQPPQQQPTNTQKETTPGETTENDKPNNSHKYIIAGVIVALVVVAIYLKRRYYGNN